MKALKIILIVLVVLVGGYFIWMATLPADYKVERSTVVDAPPQDVYTLVSDFKTWPEWSPWFQRDSTMEAIWGEQTQGTGASYSWTSTNSGSGSQSITAAAENKSIDTHVKFNGMGESDGYWKFEPTEDNKTKVTWGFTGNFPLWARVFSLGMEKQVGSDFETGLSNLKEKVESMPREPEVEIAMVTVEPMPYYGIKSDIAWSEMSSDFFAANYSEIITYLEEDAQNMTSPPFAIFHEWDEENQRAVVEPAIAVTSEKPGNEKVIKGTTYGGQALKAVHLGSYDGTGDVHYAIDDYIQTNNLTMAGSPWEVYVTDPSEQPDTNLWMTEIYYPVSQ